MSENPIDEVVLKCDYNNEHHIFEKLEEEANHILDDSLGKSGIKVHAITSRVKQFDSLLKKAQHNRMENPIQQMNDIVGLRVVCLFLSDIQKIVEIVRQSFEVVSEDNKIDVENVSSFGYMSFNLVVAIKPDYRGPRYDNLHNRKFEIQIRTLAMDAWSAVSHYLDYKTYVDIPKDLRRDFHALSGLFYVADKHFEMFFKARQEEIKKTEQLVNNLSNEMQIEINLDSLKAYLAKEFSERETASAFYISPLVTELKEASYETIGKLDAAVSRGREAFLEFERDYPHSSGKYSDVGALKTILEIVDPNFARVRGLAEDWNRKMEKYRQLIKPA